MSEENKKAELPAHRDKRFDGVRDTWYSELSKRVRVVVHFVIRTRNAYIHYGGFKGMYRRWKQKKGEASKRLDLEQNLSRMQRRDAERKRLYFQERSRSVFWCLCTIPGEVPAGNDRFCSDTDLQELGTVSGRWK